MQFPNEEPRGPWATKTATPTLSRCFWMGATEQGPSTRKGRGVGTVGKRTQAALQDLQCWGKQARNLT